MSNDRERQAVQAPVATVARTGSRAAGAGKIACGRARAADDRPGRFARQTIARFFVRETISRFFARETIYSEIRLGTPLSCYMLHPYLPGIKPMKRNRGSAYPIC